MKQNQKGFAVPELIIIAVVAIGIVGTGWFVWHGRNHSKQLDQNTNSKKQTPANPSKLSPAASAPNQVVTIKGVQIQHSTFYAVGVGSSQYYGQVQKINDDYIRLTPVYYVQGSTLTRLGGEIHAPEPAMYIRVASIASISELANTDTNYQAILNFSKSSPAPTVQDAYPSADIAKYIKPGDYQALFLTDGRIFFGHMSLGTGSLFVNPAQVFTLQSGATQTLVKVSPSDLSGYGTAQIKFWENLTTTGQISSAINAYLKSNP